METLDQTGAILRKAKVAQALAGRNFLTSEPHLCHFAGEGWTVAVHVTSEDNAAKVTIAQLAELYDGNVHIYNPQLVEEAQPDALFGQAAA